VAISPRGPKGTVTTPAKQQHILFVDDEANFLDTVRALFTAWSKNSWQIECAASADQALEILKTHSFDLVVVDVNIPVLDGEQLLRILARRYPDLKKAVITGYASEQRRSTCLANGAELYIEKPRSAEGLKSVFAMLDELVSWKQQAGFQGMLRRVGLQDVIQMECLSRNSSILEISDRKLTGQVYIEDGRIIHAVVGEVKGEAAFQKLLALPGGSFELQHFKAPGERTIEGQWEFLLMEAARVRDESASEAAPAAEPVAEPGPAPVEAPPEPSNLPPRVAEMLICSGQGAPLYQWQCADVKSRMAFMVEITQQARRVGQLLALGRFDRLEIQLSDGRAVTQMKPDRMVFVQVATEAENT
jgi:CheY-like chemotaxis protein